MSQHRASVLQVVAAAALLGFGLGLSSPAWEVALEPAQLLAQVQTIPWAWGINSGFSVLGGALSIILAQLIGFNMILILACLVYLIAGHSLTRMLELPGFGARFEAINELARQS
jgi:hypothetical protein